MPKSSIECHDLGKDDTAADSDNDVNAQGLFIKCRNAREVVSPLAHMPYREQLEHKKKSLLHCLKKLVRIKSLCSKDIFMC